MSVNITAAATKAKISVNTPAVATAAKATTTVAFNDTTIGSEASGTISFANSKVAGAEATASVLYNAKTPNAEASGALVLNGGLTLKINALNGTSVDGTTGNNVKINVTTSSSATADADGSYDAATNTLSLVLKENATSAQVATALGNDTGVNALFGFTAGTGSVAAGDAGLKTGFSKEVPTRILQLRQLRRPRPLSPSVRVV